MLFRPKHPTGSPAIGAVARVSRCWRATAELRPNTGGRL